ncbi:MAG: glutamine amidotransferase [Syntrophomonadaceae bacterium]|jgi:CobQ-like glutamine amidotransferase family enzyme|nr:glutamine amidotransferase [Syntrophomonadaceae bacterium]
MEKLIIAHMYPDLMDLYGDRGNMICLEKRIRDYGYKCIIIPVRLNEDIHYQEMDMIYMGGGSLREQKLVSDDLLQKAEGFKEVIEDGVPALLVGGAYQLLGSYYRDDSGNTIKGWGLFDFYTEAQNERLIGNILIETEIEGEKRSVVGFENHGGRTWLKTGSLQPFGTVIKGFGNNGQDGSEGIKYKNLIGTYIHGPLLPSNPHIADYFITAMAARKGLRLLEHLDDELEWLAHEQSKMKILSQR